jgi:predicted nicotinamide N-methyase
MQEQREHDLEIAGYPARLEEFRHAATRLFFYRVARLEDHVDREELLRSDEPTEPPYWAHLWLGARALARRLSESGTLTRRRVLDLGCGIGLPGLVAAALGAETWFVDREPAALEFVRHSALHNGLSAVRTACIDFSRESLPVRFDVILGAEVVYDPASYDPLCDFLVRHVAARGEIQLTDAFRSDAEKFFAELRARGFGGVRERRHEWEDGRPQGLFLWTFRRSG